MRSSEETLDDLIDIYRTQMHQRSTTDGIPHLDTLLKYLYKNEADYTTSKVVILELHAENGQQSSYNFRGSKWSELKAYLSQEHPKSGLRIIMMEGLSQSTLAIVGSQVAVDPDLFCDHFNLSDPTRSPTLRSQKYPGMAFFIKPNPSAEEETAGLQDPRAVMRPYRCALSFGAEASSGGEWTEG